MELTKHNVLQQLMYAVQIEHMAAAPILLLRLLPLLLLLLPPGLREHLSPATVVNDLRPENVSTAAADEVVLHPIVLVPGVSCSELEARLTDAYRPSSPHCGAMKGKGWFGLWANVSDLPATHYVPCFLEQMRLVYDPDADDYRNLPGVETRVRNFGSSRGFQRNPLHTDWCLEVLRQELERIGYRNGDTLFGAPYDLRHAPPASPGHESEVFSRYSRQLTRLIEGATRKSHGRKAILFGHSLGGAVALEFVRRAPAAWRDAHVKHLVLAAPLPAAGAVDTAMQMASEPDVLYVPTATPLSLRPMWRTFESAVVNFPSPAAFGCRAALVVTRRRNYSACDMGEFLADVGLCGDALRAFRRRESSMDRPPMVPTTCINGVVAGRTPEQLVYWEGDFDVAPEIVYGYGDAAVNLVSMLAFDEEMRRDQWQRERYTSVMLSGATHGGMLTDGWALKRVVQEIIRANGSG
ncbi:unnamed protein product [Urochloa humidicola]